MYDINIKNFANQLSLYRKSRGITLESIGTSIGKTKATISKYEKGEIIPDIITMLEICNVLNLNLNQLFSSSLLPTSKQSVNPFNTNKLYVYYYTENVLITSILEVINQDNINLVKFYNGIKNTSTYAKDFSYSYEGILECDNTVGYINLHNSISPSTRMEKLQISFNIPWSKSINVTNFLILALSPNSLPIVKKGIISTYEIDNFEPFDDDLKISTEELQKIRANNSWILENKNYNHFFYDT